MNCIRGDNFHCFVTFKVGDGSCITFWFDPWCGESPLKDIFVELLGVACIKEASVAELLSFLRGWFPLECQFCLTGSRLGVGVGWIWSILVWWEGMEWIRFVGNFSPWGVFILDPIIRFYIPLFNLFFHGSLFGSQKCQWRLVSFFGLQLWGES